MRSVGILIALLVIVASVQAVPPQQQYPIDNAEVLEELSRLIRASRMFPFGYYGGVPAGSYGSPSPSKRNSELINSLLGLPKVMNDAGRK